MLHPVVALGLTVLISLGVHRLDAVAHRWSPPDHLVDGLPAAMACLGFLGTFLLFGRPLVAMLLTTGGALLLWNVVRLKRRLFQEPTVFLDLALTTQIIRHPGFYVPYMFPPPVLLGAVVPLWWLGKMEPVAPFAWRWFAAFGVLSLALVAGIAARLFLPSRREAALRVLGIYKPSLLANKDFIRFGFFASVFLHALWHAQARGREGNPGIPTFEQGKSVAPKLSPSVPPLPHLVLVQAESLFDVRPYLPRHPASLFSQWDKLRSQGSGGPFLVQTHGAYTMRTEFSVLTSLPLSSLGTDAFNPYWTASRRPTWSLVWRLRELGYRTVCFHPFHLHFFRRDRVMPNLGFQELYGLDAFAGARRHGPYVSDIALAQHVLDWLGRSREPIFVFIITMEAHGPWKSGRLGGTKSPLDVYLDHLCHTDAMFGLLADGLTHLERPGVLCGYGDHAPCLSELAGATDNTPTQWLLWSTPHLSKFMTPSRALAPEALGQSMIHAAGLLRRHEAPGLDHQEALPVLGEEHGIQV